MKRVCVMDASGRLGSALVHRLLRRGYTVHAAFHQNKPQPHDREEDGNYGTDDDDCYKEESGCRSSTGGGDENNNNNSSRNMLLLGGATAWEKKLRVFSDVDPLDYHSIMEALHGCSALFYSFELPSHHPTYDEWTGELEVRAAHNVLEACAQTDTIDKVVFTSSTTAAIWRDHHHRYNNADDDDDDDDDDVIIDERNWSDINFCKKFKLWHGLSKTLAEKTAWALAMDRGVNMVSINAGLLMGPAMSIKDPYLLGAAEMFKDGVFVTVDLKFLVDAQICVLEDSSSYGRYLCFNRIINCNKDMLKLASMLLPTSPQHGMLDHDDTSSTDDQYRQRISNHKLRKLMLDFDSGAQVE